jgi:hypothetical protein
MEGMMTAARSAKRALRIVRIGQVKGRDDAARLLIRSPAAVERAAAE